MGLSVGTVKLTTNGAVGPSGKPVRVFSITVKSGGTAGVITLRNGTLAGDPEYIEIQGTANEAVTVNVGGSMHFPDGCFYVEDANVTYSTISYSLE